MTNIADISKKIITSEDMVQELGNYVVSKLRSKRFIGDIPYKKLFSGKIKEDAVLQLSDMHVGKRNEILNPDTGKLEETFNTEILIKEANRLIDGVYTINDLLSRTYDIETLHILSLGDIVDNHMIYKGQKLFVDYAVGEQIWVAVQVYSDLITALLKVFKKINLIGVIGNHGRMTKGLEEMPVSSSFDYQVMRILQVVFKNERRVSVTVPESWDYISNVKGWKYYMHHGDSVFSFMSVPYYGIVRQGKSRRIEFDYDLELIGHFHERMEIPMSSKSYTMVNGSWVRHDSFAWRKFGVLSRPGQNFFGVSEKRPRTWSFELDLNVSNTTKAIPK